MNLYKILEVDINASKATIKKSYRMLAKKYHPDLNPLDKRQEAEEHMKLINDAYEILMDDKKRLEYGAVQTANIPYKDNVVHKKQYRRRDVSIWDNIGDVLKISMRATGIMIITYSLFMVIINIILNYRIKGIFFYIIYFAIPVIPAYYSYNKILAEIDKKKPAIIFTLIAIIFYELIVYGDCIRKSLF